MTSKISRDEKAFSERTHENASTCFFRLSWSSSTMMLRRGSVSSNMMMFMSGPIFLAASKARVSPAACRRTCPLQP